ncbi:MAG TPA: energy transducer TonB [Longimicrobiaceae bacterium]|nr:energy transducer TonB [Longimicrobiaceae bacterium]
MFNKLVASEGRKQKAVSARTIVVSVAAHILLLWGVAYASENTAVGRKVKEEVVSYMEIEEQKAPEPPKPEEPPPPPPEPEEAPPPVAKGFQELVPPEEPPAKIPDVDLNQKAVNTEDFTGVGVAGGSSKGTETGVPQNMAEKEEPTGTGPIDVSLAEEQPVLQNRAEVARLLQRFYPPLLRDAGITGQAQIKFVVGADGRVAPGSATVVSATHDAFGDASTRVVEKMRFRPAKVGGRPVPVLVTLPITWALERA